LGHEKEFGTRQQEARGTSPGGESEALLEKAVPKSSMARGYSMEIDWAKISKGNSRQDRARGSNGAGMTRWVASFWGKKKNGAYEGRWEKAALKAIGKNPPWGRGQHQLQQNPAGQGR